MPAYARLRRIGRGWRNDDLVVARAGLEPACPIRGRSDFKSDVSAYSTIGPKTVHILTLERPILKVFSGQGAATNLKGEEKSSFISSLERAPKTHFEKEKGFSA